jgi:hypothetical protein
MLSRVFLMPSEAHEKTVEQMLDEITPAPFP